MIGESSVHHQNMLSTNFLVFSIFESIPFKFIVESKALYIHASLIALYSSPLERMINGNMSEAQNGFAVLEDVDEGTFGRFVRWAYTGTYAAAKVSMDVEEKSPVDTITNSIKPLKPDFDDLGSSRSIVKKDKKPSYVFGSASPQAVSYEDMKESFIRRKYIVQQSHLNPAQPCPNQGPCENYSEVFLSHARIYVFAEKYDIEPLKMLALQRLHATLSIYNLYPRRIGDIISLLRYAYLNTAQLQPGVERLRALLTSYMGTEISKLASNVQFKELLLEDDGMILGDFLTIVGKRVG